MVRALSSISLQLYDYKNRNSDKICRATPPELVKDGRDIKKILEKVKKIATHRSHKETEVVSCSVSESATASRG